MSLKLLVVLLVLMAVNQLLGAGYGTWKSGFDRAYFWSGVKKVGLILLGYSALAFAVHYAGNYVPNMEYLSGILVEPIAKYFTKICESLRSLINEPAKRTVATEAIELSEKADHS